MGLRSDCLYGMWRAKQISNQPFPILTFFCLQFLSSSDQLVFMKSVRQKNQLETTPPPLVVKMISGLGALVVSGKSLYGIALLWVILFAPLNVRPITQCQGRFFQSAGFEI